MKKVEVKEGERYGRLTIIREVEPAGSAHKRVRRFLCRCDCGNEIICRLPNLKSGMTKSCGCYRKFVSSNRRDCHHLKNTRIYRIWCGMKRRCYNKRNEHFDRIAKCSKATPYPVTFTILNRVLGILAERAIEINDPALNIIMMHLGLYEGVHDKNANEVISQFKLITDKQK